MTRDTLECDVLIVGGGPAGLSAALRLAQLCRQRESASLSVVVIDKARDAGAHMLSGAVLDPSSLRDLLPDYRERGAPLAAEVRDDRVFFLTRSGQIRFPFIPPPLRNHGNYIISLNRFVQWLAQQINAEEVDVFDGFAGRELLTDGRRVIGVRTGDRGIGRQGTRKPHFEPGVDIMAKVTILCDGVRGNLTKVLTKRLGLDQGRQPQQFAVGLKELWEIPGERVAPGTVIHTLGHPLRHEEFGGGFVYGMPEGQVSLGFVVGLDYRDPLFDPFMAFSRFKVHPLIRSLLDGGQRIRYGAKALPEGGWNTIPQPYVDGALIAGDAGGFLNSMRLKGIHLAMRTGMLAAEAAFEAIEAGDTSAVGLKRYQDKLDASALRSELYPVRNVHQAFGRGLLAGLAFSGLMLLTRGRWPRDLRGHAGHERMKTLASYYGTPVDASVASNDVRADRRLTFDKLTSVHFSGTAHEEDQPSHLLVETDVCSTVCGEAYGHPCLRFCPANVYEILRVENGAPRLQINASNCVHCKTCDIMDPYAVITWVPPEGGDGPQYNGM